MTLALLPLMAAVACVQQTGAPKAGNTVAAPGSLAATPPTSAATDVNALQPRTATYNCADGGMMTIQNLGTSVRVLGPDGIGEDLPASPANQSSRFGEAHDAIVIDGRDALVMKGGAAPLTCTR
jgi:hypothetical protein